VTRRWIVCLILFGVLAAARAAAPIAPAAASGLATCATFATPTASAPSSPAPSDSSASPAAGSVLQAAADIPLPGNATRFDYQTLDPTTGTLWIAHMGDGQLLAFDVATRRVIGTVSDLPEVTGVFVSADGGTVYASSTGDHSVAVIDAKTFAITAHLGPINFPDGIDEAPDAHRIFVSDESGGGELVIDASANTVAGSIDIGGDAGNTRYDAGSGCILVADQSNDQLVAIDPASAKIVARHDLDPRCQGPHGFTLDALRRLAFITCENNATLLVVDLATMQTTAVFPVGDGPDVLAFDPGWGRLYLASESGVVAVFDERGGSLTAVGDYQASHAHTIAVDPATHLVYLPLQSVDGKPVLRILRPAPPTS
jgi:DNA-binding beta-propeller fold protein YncE